MTLRVLRSDMSAATSSAQAATIGGASKNPQPNEGGDAFAERSQQAHCHAAACRLRPSPSLHSIAIVRQQRENLPVCPVQGEAAIWSSAEIWRERIVRKGACQRLCACWPHPMAMQRPASGWHPTPCSSLAAISPGQQQPCFILEGLSKQCSLDLRRHLMHLARCLPGG